MEEHNEYSAEEASPEEIEGEGSSLMTKHTAEFWQKTY